MIDTGCDVCGDTTVFLVYAAYNADQYGGTAPPVHPLVARYVRPMIRACTEHVGTQMMDDTESFASTMQWVVTLCPIAR